MYLLFFSIGYGFLQLFKEIWERIYTQSPWQLGLQLINRLISINKMSSNYSHSEFVNDPLLILNVDEAVFRTPLMLQIVLQIIASYMVASRKQIMNLAQFNVIFIVEMCVNLFYVEKDRRSYYSCIGTRKRFNSTASRSMHHQTR